MKVPAALTERWTRLPDINGYDAMVEFFPLIMELARKCQHVTELGVYNGTSTTAWMQGLIEGKKSKREKRSFVCVDPNAHGVIEEMRGICAEAGVSFTYHQGYSYDVPIEETDLTFIDTYHDYSTCSRELTRYGPITRRYICLHDTTLNAEVGSGGEKGLWPAVLEFLEANPEWRIERRLETGCGFTVLEKT